MASGDQAAEDDERHRAFDFATGFRDAAVSAYIAVLAAEDLRAISDWAATIRDSNLREQSLRRIAGEWMARNVEATLAWLPKSGLSAEALRDAFGRTKRSSAQAGKIGRGELGAFFFWAKAKRCPAREHAPSATWR